VRAAAGFAVRPGWSAAGVLPGWCVRHEADFVGSGNVSPCYTVKGRWGDMPNARVFCPPSGRRAQSARHHRQAGRYSPSPLGQATYWLEPIDGSGVL